MADSNITKKALATALKELMEEIPFKKISVADICGKCDMNRKSFYYHFRDKYDLVNWIFDTDAFTLLRAQGMKEHWVALEELCRYFYDNKSFYRKILQVDGQNSFSEHLREFMLPLLRDLITEIFGGKPVHSLCIDFFTDGIICSVERWLMDKNSLPPEEFVGILRNLVENTAEYIYKDMTS